VAFRLHGAAADLLLVATDPAAAEPSTAPHDATLTCPIVVSSRCLEEVSNMLTCLSSSTCERLVGAASSHLSASPSARETKKLATGAIRARVWPLADAAPGL
jgi:hypothetical protein